MFSTDAHLEDQNFLESTDIFIDHEEIIINGEIDLLNQSSIEGWTGNGTIENPIIIENYDFTNHFVNETGISLMSVNSYIVIRNNIFEIPLGMGISLVNVSNLIVFNNTFINTNFAIWSINSTNIDLTYNNIDLSNYGVKVVNINAFNCFSNNILHSNFGLTISDSVNVTLDSNIIISSTFNGISIDNTENGSIWNNQVQDIINGSGILLSGSHGFVVSENNIKNTEKNGIHVNSLSSVNLIESNTIENITEVGIYLYSANDNFAYNNTIIDSVWGMAIGKFSSNNRVLRNKISLSENMGIIIFENSDENLISDNIVDLSNIGIDIRESSNDNTVVGNIVSNNKIGLSLGSTAYRNVIFFNAFKDNNYPQANILNDENFLNNGSHGNFWDDFTGQDANNDGIGDSPYVLDWENSINDYMPLMEFTHTDLGIFYSLDPILTTEPNTNFPFNVFTSSETEYYSIDNNDGSGIFLIVVTVGGVLVVIGIGYFSNLNRKINDNRNLRNFNQSSYRYQSPRLTTFCKECGTKKVLGDLYCSECGTKL